MTGGTGGDIFSFNKLNESAPTAIDTILDFVSSDGDKINFSGIDANINATGVQGFTFIDSAAFSAAGQIRFDASTNTLSASNNGDTLPEFSLVLTAITSVLVSDFML
jgi:Ca2+-binding RTX toxin-like protein